MRYTAHGKQVMRDHQHFADAATEQAAQIITVALNAMHGEVFTPLELPAFGVVDRRAETFNSPAWDDVGIIGHTITQQSDEYACSCGMRWDVRDGHEHP